MAQSYTPFMIMIDLRRNLEDCPDVIALIKRKLLRSAFDGKDGPMRLTFVKDETGSAYEIRDRYAEIADHSDVARLRVFATCPNNASSSGILDPLTAKLDMAWRKHGERRKAKNVAHADRALIKQMKGASRQSVMGDGSRHDAAG